MNHEGMPYQEGTNPEINAKAGLLNRIEILLKSQGVQFRVLEHDDLKGSAAESSLATGTRPEQGAKALIMMSNGKIPVMVVLRGPDMADRGALKRSMGTKDLRMATLEEVQEKTGTEVGVIPAIGGLFGMETYCDEKLLDEGEIAFGTGLRTKTIMISAEDYVKVAQPIVGNYSKSE